MDKNIIYAYALKNAIEHSGKALVGSVIPGLFNHGLSKDEVKDVMKEVNSILSEVNSWDLEKQKKEFLKYSDIIGHRPEREGLPELTRVSKSGVIMRFAPSPSGPLHIGHIISNMASSIYVNKYGGKFYIRIEDTNPEKIDKNAYEGIKTDCDWLFSNVSEYIIQSDRILIYYKYAKKLISEGNSYVCTCKPEKFKEFILKKQPCPCRCLSAKENLERWEKMLDSKGFKDGEAVLRFKSDLNNSNPALRDFPLARINTKKHIKQGNKFRVWPLMNLSVTVDDIEYKMTHIIRGKDHKDNSLRQKMIYDALGKEKEFPETIFVGRIKFSDMELSKRKILAKVDEGEFEGWEDIRLPTIASLRNRGYLPESFIEFANHRGLSEVDKVISQKDFFQVLNEFNRGVLKKITKKYSFNIESEKNSDIIVIMPDNTKVYAKSNFSGKIGEIVYFDKFGYSKYNSDEIKGKNLKKVFWFCHE